MKIANTILKAGLRIRNNFQFLIQSFIARLLTIYKQLLVDIATNYLLDLAFSKTFSVLIAFKIHCSVARPTFDQTLNFRHDYIFCNVVVADASRFLLIFAE